jgi:hypothetical protein
MELASSLDRRVAALVCTAGMNQGGVPQSLPFASSGGLSCSLGLAWKELGGALMASQDNDVFLLELLFWLEPSSCCPTDLGDCPH